MGGHGGEPDECTKKLDRTFGPNYVTEGPPYATKADIDGWWPKGLWIKVSINDKTKEIEVTSNCDKLNRAKSKK